MSLKRTWTFLLEEKKTFEEVKQYFLAITLAGKKHRKLERLKGATSIHPGTSVYTQKPRVGLRNEEAEMALRALFSKLGLT